MDHPLRSMAAALLTIDAAWAVLGVTAALPFLAGHGATAIVMIALRGFIGALEFAGAWLMLDRKPAAAPVARTAVVLAAAHATLGIGFRLAPTSLDPAFRLPVVVAYWICALFVLVTLRSRRAD